MKENKNEKLVRINSRITPKQHKFAKKEADKLGIKEGPMHRIIFDFYIKNHNKIK